MTKNFSNNFSSGFTLIELLVVIAIIGILSSVVLSSLNESRIKAAAAATKNNLANARVQAELFYDSNGDSYSSPLSVCGSVATANGIKTVRAHVIAAAQAYGITPVAADFLSAKVGNTTSATCHATSAGWAAEVPLKDAPGSMWCVDANGASRAVVGSSLPSSDVTCN